MKLSNHQLEVMIHRVFDFWKQKNIATFKVDSKAVFQRAMEVLKNEFETEKKIEQEAKAMVDQLERQNPGGFEPHKMFLMIKKKLAQDKKVILGDERRSHFAHLLCDTLYDDDLVDFTEDSVALLAAKNGIEDFMKEFEALDDLVRQKVLSLKRGVVEGSPEWDTMYKKYYEEELKRKNRT